MVSRAAVVSLSSSRSVFMATLSSLILIVGGAAFGFPALQDNPHLVVYEGADGPGVGKHIVLIAGDHEYRSEEILPAMGRILAKNLGLSPVSFSLSTMRASSSPGAPTLPASTRLTPLTC